MWLLRGERREEEEEEGRENRVGKCFCLSEEQACRAGARDGALRKKLSVS